MITTRWWLSVTMFYIFNSTVIDWTCYIFCLFWTNVQSKRTTRAETEDHSLRNAVLDRPLDCRWHSKRPWGKNLSRTASTIKCKGKGHPITGHEGPEEAQRYCSTLPSTSALDGVGGQRHALAVLPPRKTRYPLYTRLGGPQGRSGLVRKISPSPGFDPRTVQPAASRCTNWSIPAGSTWNI